MRDATVARSYAATLFELAERNEGVDAFGEAVAVAASLCEDAQVREFLGTPRIPSVDKKQVLERALGPSVPPLFLNYLKVVVDKGRQIFIPEIAKEYQLLVDRRLGRRYVDVTVARPLDDAAVDELAARMSKATGAAVVPQLKVAPHILGGIVIRDGDTVYDGSLKHRLGLLRRRLLAAALPTKPQTTNHGKD